jgi:tetratricopeptide (TPR) repeat protein
MKKSYLLLFMTLALIILLAACRDPSLEQAIIDYKGSRWDQAYMSVKKAVEKVPQDPEAWYYYGEIAGQKGEVKEMVDAFDKSLALKNTFEAQIKDARIRYFSKYYNNGVQSYNSYIKLEDKESENASKILNNMIKEFQNALLIKNDFQANRLISIAYAGLEDDENRLKYLLLASESNPDTALGWVDLGFYYRNLKEYEKSIEYFEKALKVDPENTNALTLYAECLDFSGKKEQAIAAYKNANEVNPEEKAIPFNLGLLLYKEANRDNIEPAERTNYLNEAEIYFNKVYDLDPEFREIYDLYGPVLIYLKKFDAAEQILLEGTKYFPDAASIWTNLSIVYANQGKKDKANEAAKKAKELSDL